jgi:hypothetical protein
VRPSADSGTCRSRQCLGSLMGILATFVHYRRVSFEVCAASQGTSQARRGSRKRPRPPGIRIDGRDLPPAAVAVLVQMTN